MLGGLVNLYVYLFARSRFSKFNRLLFRLSLGGLGILNYKTSAISGEKAFIKRYLQNKEGVVFDVGANQGSYTKEALRVNETLKVYAFEPHPKTFRKLSENLAGCENVFLMNKGLSKAEEKVWLYDYPNEGGSSHASLFEDVITEVHGSDVASTHEVSLISLDEFVEREKIVQILLLKIDVEGNELNVLKGGLKSLAEGRIKAIHFEFNEMNVASRVFFRDFWKMLNGYKFYRLLPNEMLEIKNYSPLRCEIFAYQNIVAILKEQ